jgi:uncharacterized RDD family membrane protein YckC
MTEQNEGAPAQPESSSWQQQTPAPGGIQAAPIAAGPAKGVAYADTVTRVIAYIIDAVILSVAFTVIGVGVVLGMFATGGVAGALIGFVVLGLLYLVGSALYFIYTWTTMRASPGQKILGLETVNAADGATLGRDQAIRRWAFLFGPSALASVASFTLSDGLGLIGSLLSLLAFAYSIYLLYTVTQSQKRQGFHDVQASTVVVKRVAA